MRAPKLLPWYARKAGIPLERAEALWDEAVRRATAETGWVGNAEYWGAAADNFIDLLERERAATCAPQFLPLLRSQARMWRLPLLAIEDLLCATRASWQRHSGTTRKAA